MPFKTVLGNIEQKFSSSPNHGRQHLDQFAIISVGKPTFEKLNKPFLHHPVRNFSILIIQPIGLNRFVRFVELHESLM